VLKRTSRSGSCAVADLAVRHPAMTDRSGTDPGASAANTPISSTAASKARMAVKPTNEEWVAATAATMFLA
jgi:hypothetical protein